MDYGRVIACCLDGGLNASLQLTVRKGWVGLQNECPAHVTREKSEDSLEDHFDYELRGQKNIK